VSKHKERKRGGRESFSLCLSFSVKGSRKWGGEIAEGNVAVAVVAVVVVVILLILHRSK